MYVEPNSNYYPMLNLFETNKYSLGIDTDVNLLIKLAVNWWTASNVFIYIFTESTNSNNF